MKLVSASTWTEFGMMDHDKLSIKDINKKIQEFGKYAMQLLNSSPDKIKHVLYAIKYYDEKDTLFKVHFYMIPMTDVEFELRVASMSNVRVYAHHRN